MEFNKKDVKRHIMMPDLTYVELNDGQKIYNYRYKKNYIIIKNGKKYYKQKDTRTQGQKEKDMVQFGKIVEIIGKSM